jgi:hypothetical protein
MTVLLAWQICTGCANTREVPMERAEVERRMAFRPEDRPKHDGCYPLPNVTRSEWVTNGARVFP